MERRRMLYIKVDVEYVIPITIANIYAQHFFNVRLRRFICLMLTLTRTASSKILFVDILVKLSKLE